MQAMVLTRVGGPLEWTERPDRQPGRGEVRVAVGACCVCRTDLHGLDGELTRRDGTDFLRLAPGMGIVTRTNRYPPRQADQALADLRHGRFQRAAMLVP